MGGCLRWCCRCCKEESAHENLLIATNSVPNKGSYTVRRISSFGQTIINEKGEELEIGRHCSILQSRDVPWSSKPTSVQPGVTEADLAQRVKKMPMIIESEPVQSKQKSPWKKALSNVRKKEKDKPTNEQMELECIQREVSSQDNLSRSRRNSRKQKGVGNVRRASYLHTEPPPTTESTPNLIVDDMALPSWCIEGASSDELKKSLSGDTLSTKSCSSWLKSQSMLEMDKESVKMARMYGLEPGLYKEERSKSSEALDKTLASLKTVGGDIWPDQSSGVISFTVQYSQQVLTVHVHKVDGLCGEGIDKKVYTAVIKMCILPGKRLEKNSRSLGLSLNPTVEQAFTFPVKHLQNKILRLSVYNELWQGNYDAVGHALFYLEDATSEPKNHKMKLYHQSTPDESVGMIQITLNYSEEEMTVIVLRAFKLLPELRDCKIYAKVSFYKESKKFKEKILEGKKKGVETEIVFDDSGVKGRVEQELRCYVVVSLKTKRGRGDGVFTRDKVRGRLTLGPYIYTEDGRGFTPWGLAISRPFSSVTHSYRMYL